MVESLLSLVCVDNTQFLLVYQHSLKNKDDGSSCEEGKFWSFLRFFIRRAQWARLEASAFPRVSVGGLTIVPGNWGNSAVKRKDWEGRGNVVAVK